MVYQLPQEKSIGLLVSQLTIDALVLSKLAVELEFKLLDEACVDSELAAFHLLLLIVLKL